MLLVGGAEGVEGGGGVSMAIVIIMTLIGIWGLYDTFFRQ